MIVPELYAEPNHPPMPAQLKAWTYFDMRGTIEEADMATFVTAMDNDIRVLAMTYKPQGGGKPTNVRGQFFLSPNGVKLFEQLKAGGVQ